MLISKPNPAPATERFNESCAQANQEMLSDMYHIYRDDTLFEYNVNLVRTDLSTNRNERYNVKVKTPVYPFPPQSPELSH